MVNPEPLETVLEWMKTTFQIVDEEAIAYDPEFRSFPLEPAQYHRLWTDIVGLDDPYVDQGWAAEDEFEEARYYFEHNGTKFIVRWLNGQGYIHQIILAGYWDDRVPFDEEKKVVI